MDASKEPWAGQTWRPGCFFEAGLLRRSWRTEMRREDLMNPDLLSEVVLVGSVALMVGALLLIVMAALTQPTAVAWQESEIWLRAM
jgi:hypothetical protein